MQVGGMFIVFYPLLNPIHSEKMMSWQPLRSPTGLCFPAHLRPAMPRPQHYSLHAPPFVARAPRSRQQSPELHLPRPASSWRRLLQTNSHRAPLSAGRRWVERVGLARREPLRARHCGASLTTPPPPRSPRAAPRCARPPSLSSAPRARSVGSGRYCSRRYEYQLTDIDIAPVVAIAPLRLSRPGAVV